MKKLRFSSISFMVYSLVIFGLGMIFGVVVFKTDCVNADVVVEDNIQVDNIQLWYNPDREHNFDDRTIGCTMHCQAGVALFCNGMSPDKKSCKMHYVEGSEKNFNIEEFCNSR